MNPTAIALLDTLAICKQALPKDMHPIWIVRIQVIERMIRHTVEHEPQIWADTLRRAEHTVDLALAQRQRSE
jgi:hypothetical protein